MPKFSHGYQNGDVRFNCECGKKFQRPEPAFQHSMAGHACVFEVYAMGKWEYTGATVLDLIAQGIHQRGESEQHFTNRLASALAKRDETVRLLEADRSN